MHIRRLVQSLGRNGKRASDKSHYLTWRCICWGRAESPGKRLLSRANCCSRDIPSSVFLTALLSDLTGHPSWVLLLSALHPQSGPTPIMPQLPSLHQDQLWNPFVGQALDFLSAQTGSLDVNRLQGGNTSPQSFSLFPGSRRCAVGKTRPINIIYLVPACVFCLHRILSSSRKEPLHFNQVFCTWQSSNKDSLIDFQSVNFLIYRQSQSWL